MVKLLSYQAIHQPIKLSTHQSTASTGFIASINRIHLSTAFIHQPIHRIYRHPSTSKLKTQLEKACLPRSLTPEEQVSRYVELKEGRKEGRNEEKEPILHAR